MSYSKKPSYFEVRDQLDRELYNIYPYAPEDDPGEIAYASVAHALIRYVFYAPTHKWFMLVMPRYATLEELAGMTRIRQERVQQALSLMESRDNLITVSWTAVNIDQVSIEPLYKRTPVKG